MSAKSSFSQGSSSRREAKRTASALSKETRNSFEQTAGGMLRAFQQTWPDDELLRAAVEEFQSKIERCPSQTLKNTRIDLAVRLLADNATERALALVNARDMEFFDSFEQEAQEMARRPSNVAQMAAFAASLSGHGDILSSLRIGERMRADDMDDESMESVWQWVRAPPPSPDPPTRTAHPATATRPPRARQQSRSIGFCM